jgi:2'-5' RNA ligase
MAAFREDPQFLLALKLSLEDQRKAKPAPKEDPQFLLALKRSLEDQQQKKPVPKPQGPVVDGEDKDDAEAKYAGEKRISTSYILKTDISRKINTQLQNGVLKIHTIPNVSSWWGDSPFAPHLTIALAKGDEKDSENLIATRKQTLTERVQKNVLDQFDKRVFLMPYDIEISENGWIKLNLIPLDIEEGDDARTRLRVLHEVYLNEATACGLKFEAKFCGENFAPHISIGKVKGAVGGVYPPNVLQQAKNRLAQMKKQMLNRLEEDLPILNVFHLSLNHGREVLAEKRLKPINLGVQRVEPIGTYQDSNLSILFRTKEDATRCSRFLFHLAIRNEDNIRESLFVDTYLVRDARGRERDMFGFNLSKENYAKIAGLIHNCVPGLENNEPSAGPRRRTARAG